MSGQMLTQKETTLTFTPAQSGLLQRKCACGNHTVAGGECASCRKKRAAGLQRAAATPAPAGGVPAQVHDVLRSSGQPLDSATRTALEPRFGSDFSRVRVHTDGAAAESAQAVNALAYTVGDHIVFGAGQYAPQSPSGGQVLAHELTHVVQQGMSSGSGPQYAKAISQPGDAAEVEAEAAAQQVVRGGSVQVRQPASAAVQGLGIGEAIGIGVGAAAGAVGIGLGIAALAGAFGGRRRWSIRQANTDGPNYASAADITFNPDRATMNCSEIAFVQSLIFADAGTGSSVETIPNYVSRRTANGWTLDRIEARRYGWYSYNNDGRPGGNVSPGSSPSPLRAATMHDTPRDTRPNSVFRFETCAICKAGTDVNQVYGCYIWGFNVDGANHLTSLPNQETATPSAEFAETVRQWNIQAAGPAAQRNDPNQQPLGPFTNSASSVGAPGPLNDMLDRRYRSESQSAVA